MEMAFVAVFMNAKDEATLKQESRAIRSEEFVLEWQCHAPCVEFSQQQFVDPRAPSLEFIVGCQDTLVSELSTHKF